MTMINRKSRVLLGTLLLLTALSAQAVIETYEFADPADREQFKELLFHFAIENGRPDIIENAPDRFSNQDPTGVTEDMDEYREALNAARRAQAVKIKGAQDAAAQADQNRSRMRNPDSVWRAQELVRLQSITADPAAAREYLLRSSMITGLRRAAEIA